MGIQKIEDTFEKRKWSFMSAFSICMTVHDFEISQFYGLSESKKLKWNKIRHFSMGDVKLFQYFNDFYNWHFSLWAQTSAVK